MKYEPGFAKITNETFLIKKKRKMKIERTSSSLKWFVGPWLMLF